MPALKRRRKMPSRGERGVICGRVTGCDECSALKKEVAKLRVENTKQQSASTKKLRQLTWSSWQSKKPSLSIARIRARVDPLLDEHLDGAAQEEYIRTRYHELTYNLPEVDAETGAMHHDTFEKVEKMIIKEVGTLKSAEGAALKADPVGAFVRALPKERLVKLMKGSKAELAVMEEAVRAYKAVCEKQMNASKMLGFNLDCLISRRKYIRLDRILSRELDDDGNYKRATHEVKSGMHTTIVELPRPPSYYSLINLQHEIALEYGLDVTLGGKSVKIHFPSKLRHTISVKLRDGLLKAVDGEIVDRYGNGPTIQWKGDAANIHKNMKQTVVGISWPHCAMTDQAQHPLDFECLCMFEAGDGSEDMLRYGSEHILEVNRLLGDGVVIMMVNQEGGAPSLRMDFTLVGGGDMAMINSMVGLPGCNCSNPCPFCTAPKEDMCEERQPDEEDGWQERTLEFQRRLAHTVAGVDCPGCGMHIVEVVTDPATQMKVASLSLSLYIYI
jgi:hypothetical protein